MFLWQWFREFDRVQSGGFETVRSSRSTIGDGDFSPAAQTLMGYQEADPGPDGRQGDVAWFMNGKLNASVCCIDQHLATRADQVTDMT